MKDGAAHPLVLVFYLDKEMMQRPEVINQFAESINYMIIQKELNALALFMPTETEERVECINPVIATEEQIANITKLIADIEKNFSIGGKLNEN